MTDDRTRIELEVEVPGTPEEVWRAIATGPGITSSRCSGPSQSAHENCACVSRITGTRARSA